MYICWKIESHWGFLEHAIGNHWKRIDCHDSSSIVIFSHDAIRKTHLNTSSSHLRRFRSKNGKKKYPECRSLVKKEIYVYKSFKSDHYGLVISHCTYKRCRRRLYSAHEFNAMSGFQCSFDINKHYSRKTIVCCLISVLPPFCRDWPLHYTVRSWNSLQLLLISILNWQLMLKLPMLSLSIYIELLGE